ncbi:MAG TPA: chromosomal replication initiator protein DnaA [Hyphomicrobiaceae bacterium]|nr:chromosomal replication initiator protein DnaA [Hyphomicrobiaceae bacterium]
METAGNTAGTTAAGGAIGGKARAVLRARFGEEVYSSWFHLMEFESFDGRTVRTSLPTKFLQTWIQAHYADALLECCKAEFAGAERLDVVVREYGTAAGRRSGTPLAVAGVGTRNKPPLTPVDAAAPGPRRMPAPAIPLTRTSVNGFEGSPLDPKYTFESFVEGKANRMALTVAQQVAASVLDEPRAFNPLFLHSQVGLGKTHLLHAIAWEVKRHAPKAQVLYLTAERFRYQFVEAIRSQDAMAFKEKFRAIDILLIDDLEFMQGEKTEQEFEHIVNALLDGSKQVVVASARPPAQLERLNDRMRSRMQRGLTVEISALDEELRAKILERRVQEKRSADPAFEISSAVLQLLADRLTESGRELEGAVNRLYLTWQLTHAQITIETVEGIIRDLVLGIEPRRIKVEDILRIVSRHFAVSKADILSDRRHRSVVRPRQIGMYLAKQLTSRSLPEIGRRFGNRDHTTVLHAIRKIDKEIGDNPHLKEEIEELKRQLNR